MNFAIDNPAPPAPAPPAISRETEEFADMMLSRAFLGAQTISNFSLRPVKNEIVVRVEQVFRTRTTIYVHYTIENNSEHAYRVETPSARQLEADKSSISVPALLHKQLDQRLLEKLGNTQEAALPVGHGESESEEIKPGEATQGVVAIRQNLASPSIVQLVFSNRVKATFVL